MISMETVFFADTAQNRVEERDKLFPAAFFAKTFQKGKIVEDVEAFLCGWHRNSIAWKEISGKGPPADGGVVGVA
jgi:hypothetical protein